MTRAGLEEEQEDIYGQTISPGIIIGQRGKLLKQQEVEEVQKLVANQQNAVQLLSSEVVI